MMPKSSDAFYSSLPINDMSLGTLLVTDKLFHKIPADWHVLITDVKNSTLAVQSGLHETINLVATGSIVAVLNIAYKANLTIPFFFGGDGATFIIPPSIVEACLQALLLHQRNTMDNFKLDLRTGHVAVEEIYLKNHSLNISKFKTSALFATPILLGEGLIYAEKKIKADDYNLENKAAAIDDLDLTGMQCRWDRIKPPDNCKEVISLLVLATDNKQQSTAFKRVTDSLDKIYGHPESRTPISVNKLKLKATLLKIGMEMKVRLGGFRPTYLLINWFKTLLGFFYFKTKKGQAYLNTLVEMSDTLIIDGRINTVISGTTDQRIALEKRLNQLEKDGTIIYGLHVSEASVMSCFVSNMNDKHIHFVDGSEGGYTKAAAIIKKKLSRI